MSTKFLSPGWRMPRNANQSKQSNYSLSFNGNNQYIDLGNSTQVQPVKEMSISAWINASSLATYRGIVSCMYNGLSYDGFVLRLDEISSNKIQFVVSSTAQIRSTSTITTGQWYHLVATYDGANIKLYFNGSLESSASLTGNIDYSDGSRNTTIGSLYPNTYEFTGQINAVCIFDYALSESQVTTLWGGGTEVSNPMALPSPPIAYYPLGTSAWNGEYLAENNAIGDYVFDFTPNDYIDIVNSSTAPTSLQSLGNSNSYSISSWINTTTTDTYSALWFAGKTILEMRNEGTTGIHVPFNLSVSSGKLFFGRSSNYTTSSENYSSTTDVNTGSWVHCIATVDNNTLKFYINGSLDSTHTFTTATGDCSVGSNTSNFFIGSRSTDGGGNDAYFDGSLSNTQIFNTALTGPEVETLYNYGSPIQTLANIPQSSNLKAWYKLDATEIYNSTSTEWSVDNNQNPSTYPSSLNFDGVNDYIRINPIIDTTNVSGGIVLPDNFTVSYWIKTTSSVNNKGAINGQVNSDGIFSFFRFALIRNGEQNLRINNSYIPVTPIINNGDWYNIIYCNSYDNTELKVYTNNSPTYENTTHNFGRGNNIGNIARAEISSVTMDMQMSNLSVWNKQLSSSEVSEIYNNGTPSNLSSHSATSNLVSWYKLNNTTTGIEDSKGSNNGTNNGATEYPGFVNTLAGDSSGMSQSNLVQSDLQTVAPYSKYAMSFDGNGYIDSGSVGNFTSSFTASCWVNNWPSSGQEGVLGNTNGQNRGWILLAPHATNSNAFKAYINTTAGWYSSENLNGFSDNTKWVNLVFIYDSINNTLMLYSNASEGVTATQPTGTLKTGADPLRIASEAGNNNFNGNISNVAIWNTALSASEVREIYNEGIPSNLHNFSGAAPVAWWQLGENSSFNGNDWICADEIGSNNGESNGMPVGALTNGVGTTANGTSTGMSEGSLVGDAPYSTGNAISRGMPVTARGTDVPPTILNDTYSLNFDGTNETLRFIDANGSYTFNEFAGANGTQSYSFWIKPDIDGTIDYIMSGDHVQYGGILFDNGFLRYYARYQGDWTTDLELTNNVWQHVALVFDLNGLVQPYKNGQPTTALTNIPMPYKSYYDRIGMLENRYHPMKGNLDEFSAYNYALSANQVQSIYNGVFGTPNNVLSLNPILYYRFEEGTGTTINDSSTAGLNAYKTNGITFQTEAP